MRFFGETNVNFVGIFKWTFAGSVALAVVGLISLIAHGGLRYGVDFAGGVLAQVRFDNPVTVQEVRAALDPAGYGLAELQLSHDVRVAGRPEVLIRAASKGEGVDAGEEIKAALRQKFGDSFEMRRVEMVGPKIGKELRKNALWAILFSLAGLLIYMSWRFEFRSGVAAIVALAHDVFMTIGLISLTNREMTLTVLAALLTLTGYSINDTIVVFDRIREDRRLYSKDPLRTVINRAVNKTLSRTLITGGLTWVAVVFLFLFGGEVIHDMMFALMVGILLGTYSSIFIASPLVLVWETRFPRGGRALSSVRGARASVSRSRRREETGART